MQAKNFLIATLAVLLVAHIIFDFYFINFVYRLEDKTSLDYANHNSKIVNSWLGGERLVNTENGMRSATFQKFYSNDFWRNKDSLVRFSAENGKIGFLNSNTMKIVIPPRFMIATEFSDGLALAVSDSIPEKYGFINRQGYWKIRPNYDLSLISGDDDTTYFTPRFHGKFCKIRTKKELYAFINTTGEIKSHEYRQILSLMPGNYRIVEKSLAKWGLMDSTFNETFAPIYRSKEEVIKLYKRTILNKLK